MSGMDLIDQIGVRIPVLGDLEDLFCQQIKILGAMAFGFIIENGLAKSGGLGEFDISADSSLKEFCIRPG